MGCECDTKSHEIIDIVRDAVGRISERYLSGHGKEVQFVHGNTVYVKEVLDALTQSFVATDYKYPLIVLFTPFEELRGASDLYTSAEVQITIVNGSVREWTNEQREQYNFRTVLRPLYNMLLEELMNDKRIRMKYDGNIPHKYSENYSYGRYGATDANGEMLSDPIDAINIKSLKLEVKPIKNCFR